MRRESAALAPRHRCHDKGNGARQGAAGDTVGQWDAGNGPRPCLESVGRSLEGGWGWPISLLVLITNQSKT